MGKLHVRRPSPAMAVAILALIVAFSALRSSPSTSAGAFTNGDYFIAVIG